MRGAVRVLMLALAACGDNLGGVSVDDFNAASSDALCRYVVQCGLLPDVESCAQTKLFTANISRWELPPEFIAAAHAGTLIWSPTAAARCLARPRSCDSTDDTSRLACEPFSTGTLHDGDPCMVSAECLSNECWTNYSTEACYLGYCVGDAPPVAGRIGDACQLSPCLEGYCDTICRPRLGEGAACLYVGQCEDGLVCRPTTGDPLTMRCTALPDRGEPCTGPCARVGDHCGANSGLCEAPHQLDQPCGQDTDCAPFYRCGPSQRCVDPGVVPLGGPCGSHVECADVDTYCHLTMAQCVLPPPAYVCGD